MLVPQPVYRKNQSNTKHAFWMKGISKGAIILFKIEILINFAGYKQSFCCYKNLISSLTKSPTLKSMWFIV